MRKLLLIWISLSLLLLLSSCTTTKKEKQEVTKRVGQVIRLKGENLEEYKKLHADSTPGVRDLLNKYHLHNFNIFLHKIDGEWYEFAYFEYTGNNYQEDMKKLAQEPRNIEWLKKCDPMQKPLEGSEGWTQMERIYFNE